MFAARMHASGARPSVALLLVLACHALACGATSQPPTEAPPPRIVEVKAPSCPERDRLTADAVALAAQAEVAPSDASHDAVAVTLATKLAQHNAQHHARDLTGDRRGYRALRPALIRAGGRSDCATAHALSQIYAEYGDGGSAVDLWEGPARVCATPGDVSLACTHSGGRLTPEQNGRARALLREVWSKAKVPAEKYMVMRSVEACSSSAKEVKTNLDFVPDEMREAYFRGRGRERAQDRQEIDANLEAETAARGARSQCLEGCLGLFGFSATRQSTLCDLCRGETTCVQRCNEASVKCAARCGGP